MFVKDIELYEKLYNQKKNGKIFTRDDLTYDILYELSIIENVTDSLIGEIFNLTKEQVKYLRKKHKLNNVFLVRQLNNHDQYINNMVKQGYNQNSISDDLFYESLREFSIDKGWNTDIINNYIKSNEIDLKYLETEYDVVMTNSIFINKKESKKTNRTNTGKNINQTKANISKEQSGKLGERIVYQNEIKRLKELNRYDLASKVRWVSKTDDTNITYDGLGYDIISYNDKGEKIYIEVKCSTTSNSDISFYISSKEVEFIQGRIDGIDKNHCFIYYVYNINHSLSVAEIIIIDYNTFKSLNLVPHIYKVDECFIKNN